MGCACGGGKSTKFVLTTSEGRRLSYNTEVEAVAAQRRLGGTVTKPKA